MFGISHQKAGLNWAGRYKDWSRERALAKAWRAWTQRKRKGSGFRVQGSGNGNGEHAKWRRITGITEAVEHTLTRKQRRAGLKRLVERIKEFTTENTENTEKRQGSGFRVQGIGNDERPLSLTNDWGGGVESWAGSAGNSIESMCAELEVSRAGLTMLTKEYCGLTVQELADGYTIRRVKRGLVERLREAAQQLWGAPGSYAATKYEMEPQMNTDEHGYRVQGMAKKRSRYFRMTAEDYYYEDRASERARRCEELAARMREDFDLEDWAARSGFASGARLKRACVNVLGRSLRALERALAAEVVRYYLCAEDKVLRQVACGAESARVARARWAYNQSEDPPTEPFLDEWSKAEELARDWLEKMREGFG
ncbi:MAG: hypothetical protein NTW87_07495 [Planctomycetota bacterium]|nr:hypothetical protein [Planctomycetota bacterium]